MLVGNNISIVTHSTYFASGVCLLRGDTGPCDALGYPFFFNSSSDRCETFQYGGCRGNGNRFSTGLQCAAACNPDGEYFIIFFFWGGGKTKRNKQTNKKNW